MKKVIAYFLVPLVIRLCTLGALGGFVATQTGCGKVTSPEVIAILNSIETAAVNVLTIAGQITPAQSATIKNDIALAEAAFNAWHTSPGATTLQKFQAAMKVVSDFLGPALVAAGAVNPLLGPVIEIVISEIQSVLAVIAAAQTTTNVHAMAKMKIVPPLSAKDFKAEFNLKLPAGMEQYQLK